MFRVLVTGASGFIGRHVVKALLNRDDIEVVIGASRTSKLQFELGSRYFQIPVNIKDSSSIKGLIKFTNPDIIIHLAANPLARLSTYDPDGAILWDTNVEGTHNLLKASPRGVRFVLASSASIYGSQGNSGPCAEYLNPRPTSLYAASKVAAEALVSSYSAQECVQGVCVRYVANCGPGSTHGLVHDVMAKLKSDSTHLELFGNEPGSVKPFIYVGDAASATLFVALSKLEGVWNVSVGDFISVKDVAEIAMDVMGVRKPIKWLGEEANWPGDNPFVNVAGYHLKSRGWQPQCKTSADAVREGVRASLRGD